MSAHQNTQYMSLRRSRRAAEPSSSEITIYHIGCLAEQILHSTSRLAASETIYLFSKSDSCCIFVILLNQPMISLLFGLIPGIQYKGCINRFPGE